MKLTRSEKELVLATELNDEIYETTLAAEKLAFAMNELREGYFEFETASPARFEDMLVNYDRAYMQLTIALDYAFELRNQLRQLEAATR